LAATAVLAAALLSLLGGCSGTMIADHLPAAAGGLPADAPARTEAEVSYPAVHNVPPARGAQPLSSDQQKQVEDELVAARNRYGASPNGPVTTGSTAGSTTANTKAATAQNP
jgi:hypothetical protein